MQRGLVLRDAVRAQNQPLRGYTIGGGQTDRERRYVAISVRFLLEPVRNAG